MKVKGFKRRNKKESNEKKKGRSPFLLPTHVSADIFDIAVALVTEFA